MTTFMAINLGKDMRRQKKEKQALVNERNKLAIQKTEKAMKKLKEEKIELERGFEVGLRVQLITNITILTILTNLTNHHHHQGWVEGTGQEDREIAAVS